MTAYISYRICRERILEFIDYSYKIVDISKSDPTSLTGLHVNTYKYVTFSGNFDGILFDVKYFEIRKYLHFFDNLFRKHCYNDELERKFELCLNDTYGLEGRHDWLSCIKSLIKNREIPEETGITNSQISFVEQFNDIPTDFDNIDCADYSRNFWRMTYVIEGIMSAVCKMKSIERIGQRFEYVPRDNEEDFQEQKVVFDVQKNVWDENGAYVIKLDILYNDYIEKKNTIKMNMIKSRLMKRNENGLRGM
jgi:hypothetical protein